MIPNPQIDKFGKCALVTSIGLCADECLLSFEKDEKISEKSYRRLRELLESSSSYKKRMEEGVIKIDFKEIAERKYVLDKVLQRMNEKEETIGSYSTLFDKAYNTVLYGEEKSNLEKFLVALSDITSELHTSLI